MKEKKNLLKIGATIILFGLFLSFSNCNEDGNKEDNANDTTIVEKVVKKTRKELIVNRDTMKIANLDSISAFENKHTPDITFGELDEKGYAKVFVKVGSNNIVHPSTEDHWIDFMTLYIDGDEVKHIDNENGEGSNTHDFFVPIKKGQIVKIIIGCNLHGIWENEKIFE